MDQKQYGMLWKKSFIENYCCGKDDIYQKEETYFDQKYLIEFSNLLNVFICHPQKDQLVNCLYKQKKEGLGIRSLSLLNRALLGKWHRRYVFDGDVFWKKIIKVKCGKEGEGWHPCEVSGGYGIDVWKVIRNGWDLFFRRTSLEVGNGRRVKFQTDKLCGEEPLCLSFPSLYALVVFKEAQVVDFWDDIRGIGHWTLMLH